MNTFYHDQKNDSTIKSVHKALDIVDYVADNPKGISVTDLSEGLQINKSTVSKMLATLEMHNYVQQDPETHRYRLGVAFLHLATRVTDSYNILSIAEHYLLALRDKTGETVNFALYNDHCLTYIATYEGTYPVRLSSTAGMKASILNSAVGKATLAFLHEPDLSELNKSLIISSEGDLVRISEEIEKTKKRGYSINRDELTPGVSGVGAPIYNYNGKLVAAVAVAGLSARIDKTTLDSLGEALRFTCQEISKQLGYQSPKEVVFNT